REDDRPGGEPVVILNYDLWQRVFKSDPSVLGRAITLRGQTYTVIGVMPQKFPVTERSSFEGGAGVDLWTPLKPSTSGEGGGVNYEAIVRLRDGVSWP